MTPATRLVLWDVDGTLVWTGPVTRHAFDRAVTAEVGRPADGRAVSFGGKTDPQIALEILATMGVEGERARDHLPAVIDRLVEEMAAAEETIRREGRVLPGVAELLERLADRPDVVQTVLTGNVEANARLKVGAFGLDRFLDLEVAATGSDHADRQRLVPVAVGKVAERRGLDVAPDHVWVIGDTGLDLVCARVAGANCILVATGMVPLDELAGLGAEAAFADLSDVDAVERLLLGGS